MSDRHTLAAIRFEGISHWQSYVQEQLEMPGWSVEQVRSSIWLVPGTASGTIPSGHQYRNAYQLSSFWSGPRMRSVSVTPIRKWANAAGEADTRPEYLILDGRKAPSLRLEVEVENVRAILAALSALKAFSNSEIRLDVIDETLDDLASVQVGDRVVTCPPNLNAQYRQFGFHAVPDNFTIQVIPLGGVPPSIGSEFAARLTSAFRERATVIDAHVGTLEAVTKRAGQAVVLLLEGQKTTALSGHTIAALRELDEQGILWRRAYATDPFQYSIPDQVASILQCAGGIPYCTSPRGERALPWSLGIDLSHPEEGPSRLCAALVNPSGIFEQAWVSEHRRDETISSTILQDLMRRAVASIPSDTIGRGLLILRDGRLFEKEQYSFYREGFGLPVSLMELRKRKNPPILTSAPEGIPGRSIFTMIPQERDSQSHISCVVTLPATGEKSFGRVLKLHWRDDWNDLDLRPRDVASIIAALTHAHGLGNRARTLPAPVYWADGIAAASDRDLRFRGQRATLI